MRLFEAIVEANHRALAGDASAGLHPSEFADDLPVAALTCIDARLNPLFPEVLGLPKERFIWLRNAGNIITGPLSSTMRSLALACVVKGAKEIAIIGHNDCLVCKTSALKLTEAFRAFGIDRTSLPENLTEFFGLFASERQNVIKAAEFVRHSPLIGPKVPVHGLLVDIESGKLEWIVNGYQTLESVTIQPVKSGDAPAAQPIGGPASFADFEIGVMKFVDTKIGEYATKGKDWLVRETEQVGTKLPAPKSPTAAPAPPIPPPIERKLPLPPPIRPSINVRKWKK